MNNEVLILTVEAVLVYLLVLWTHSLRFRFGLGPFYALLGGITAVMSWVTDAGVQVDAGGITFMVGSTVFYTALLLGVFVVYVFDGPHSTRVAIFTVAGVSILVPVIAVVLNVQMHISGHAALAYVPVPSLRINTASVLATMADLVFLAMAWEVLGRPELGLKTWLRAFITLLGVMWLDVLLFATGAFAGTPGYLKIMSGTFMSRLVISIFAYPFLYAYLTWQNRKHGTIIENRPVLSILRAVAEARAELGIAQREIARRRQAEEAAKQGQALSKTIIESIPGSFYMIGPNGQYIGWNACQRDEIAGASEDRMPGIHALDTIHPDDRALIRSKIVNVLEHGVEEIVEGRVLLRGGPDFRWLLMTGRRILLNGQKTLIGIGIDITEHKRLEAEKTRLEDQYRQLQKADSLGRMAGAVAHHFNNQLHALRGNLELAQTALGRGTDVGADLAEALKAACKASELSGLMLAYLGQQTGKQEPLDLAAICRRALPALRNALPPDIALEMDGPVAGPVVKATADQIGQVMTNLVTNAWESLGGSRGVVRLALTTVSPAEIPGPHRFPLDWQSRQQPYACLAVTDTGCGIPEADIEKIFDPFYTTKFIGRGLGLPVVLGVVRAHGGAVAVESQPGRGTRMRVFLPVWTETAPRPAGIGAEVG